MKTTFVILAAGDLLLLSVTFVVGLMVAGQQFFPQHFMLGLLSALYTFFVHVIAYTYFTVSWRVVRQAAAERSLDPAIPAAVLREKSRVFTCAMLAIACTLCTAALGALVTESSHAAAWGVSARWHLLAAFTTLAMNTVAFCLQFASIDRNASLFEQHFERA